MTASDFRRIALSFQDAEEGSHMGQADFRVGGSIFATLAAEKQGYGNLLLTLEQQAAFVAELPGSFSRSQEAGAGMAQPIFVSRQRAKVCLAARCRPLGSCDRRRISKREQNQPDRQGKGSQSGG